MISCPVMTYGRCFAVYGINMFCYPNANQCPAFSSTIQHIFSILPSESHSGHQVGHVIAFKKKYLTPINPPNPKVTFETLSLSTIVFWLCFLRYLPHLNFALSLLLAARSLTFHL